MAVANVKWDDYERRLCPDDDRPLRVRRGSNSVGQNVITGYLCDCGNAWQVIAWNAANLPGMLRHANG